MNVMPIICFFYPLSILILIVLWPVVSLCQGCVTSVSYSLHCCTVFFSFLGQEKSSEELAEEAEKRRELQERKEV